MGRMGLEMKAVWRKRGGMTDERMGADVVKAVSAITGKYF